MVERHAGMGIPGRSQRTHLIPCMRRAEACDSVVPLDRRPIPWGRQGSGAIVRCGTSAAENAAAQAHLHKRAHLEISEALTCVDGTLHVVTAPIQEERPRNSAPVLVTHQLSPYAVVAAGGLRTTR